MYGRTGVLACAGRAEFRDRIACEVRLADKLSEAPVSQNDTASEELYVMPAARVDPQTFHHIRLRTEPPVARMTLDHPEHNLLNEPALRELAVGLEIFSAREDIKAIVLDAAGKVF